MVKIDSKQDNKGSTELAQKLDLNQYQKYGYKYLVFPQDLGMMDNGHYMIININVPTSSAGESRSSLNNQGITSSILNLKSKVDQLRFESIGAIGTAPQRSSAAVPRSTRRIAESIALYMPRPLIYNTQNVYEDISLTALAGKLGTSGADALKAFGKLFQNRIGGALQVSGSLLGTISSPLNSRLARTLSQVALTPINPAIEILFSNTTVRQFVFEFLLAPRNVNESDTIKNIIQTLRFHAAPEMAGAEFSIPGIQDASTQGFYFIPPAEFDITFYNKGVENLNILRINTCILDRVEVDYSPAGVYSTFTNGHPVATRLSLSFRELEPVHKARVLQGF